MESNRSTLQFLEKSLLSFHTTKNENKTCLGILQRKLLSAQRFSVEIRRLWFYACPSLSFCQSETNCVYRSRVQAVVAALSCTVSNQYLTSARGAFFPCSFLMKSRKDIIWEIVPSQLSFRTEGSPSTGRTQLVSPGWTSESLLLSFFSIDVSWQNISYSTKTTCSLSVFQELH